MKNQTPRLSAKTVNANLAYIQENTSFSRSRYEVQGLRAGSGVVRMDPFRFLAR